MESPRRYPVWRVVAPNKAMSALGQNPSAPVMPPTRATITMSKVAGMITKTLKRCASSNPKAKESAKKIMGGKPRPIFASSDGSL
jgi:hypothetical protein